MENYPDYIEAYFSGALSPEERKEFEKRIEMDKNFAEEVAFYLSAKQVLKEELIKEKKDWFRQLADQNPDLEKKPAQVRTMYSWRRTYFFNNLIPPLEWRANISTIPWELFR
jgi:anti-sigma factor RsiW